MCQRGCWLRWHDARLVNDYADTDQTTRTLPEFSEGVSQALKEQSGEKKLFGCVYNSKNNNLKIWKPPHLKKSLPACVVVDYADTQFSIFAIEYLRKKEKVCENIFACSYGAQF